MSLQVVYQSFLASPAATALSADASFNYITTLTTINNSAAIVKHLTNQDKILKKKQEKILSSIESHNAICLEVETTLEFLSGGGAYLPGLDDNFVADQEATLPIVSRTSHCDSSACRLILNRFISFSSTPVKGSSRSVFTGTKAPFSSSLT